MPALRILDVVGEYAAEVEAAWGISDFNARVGINTGETAVGLVGAADPQAVVLGDTPNVAARLQSAARARGRSPSARRRRARSLQRFVLEPLGRGQRQGPRQAGRGLAARLVRRRRRRRAPDDAPRRPRGRGRRASRRSPTSCTAGRGQIVFLLGDAGIGKTRLLGELRRLAGERVTWLEGHCLSYGTELLYGPFIEMLRELGRRRGGRGGDLGAHEAARKARAAAERRAARTCSRTSRGCSR